MVSDLTPLRRCWLALSVLGGIAGLRISAPDATEIVAMITLALWCLVETMVRRNWLALITVPAMVLGLGCALPLYLFLRSRRIS
ncbi:DUF2834 domain-containing protein [Paracoccus aerodenitrificans]|uniref:DUF2834 domain-containing protein n=1 Tax=Paracoccus aerodenitrificans TaxID=3017781 RepID=UPI0022EFDFB9|nr:DUF2834 domain-containing protein [Paracoccus aerodenitrificans]WBU64360.1 DUF2834 domain-containing protein [Paracoccus aerodenitrificans]